MNKNENNVKLQVKWHSFDETPIFSNNILSEVEYEMDKETGEYFEYNDLLMVCVKHKKTGELEVWQSNDKGGYEYKIAYGKFMEKLGFYEIHYNAEDDDWCTACITELFEYNEEYTFLAWAFLPIIEFEPCKE